MVNSGWIGILAQWSRDKDIQLASPAARALANLDLDDNKGEMYSQSIFPLHPLLRNRTQRKMDVIFIHGLLGGLFFTWRQRYLHLIPTEIVGLSAIYFIQIIPSSAFLSRQENYFYLILIVFRFFFLLFFNL